MGQREQQRGRYESPFVLEDAAKERLLAERGEQRAGEDGAGPHVCEHGAHLVVETPQERKKADEPVDHVDEAVE